MVINLGDASLRRAELKDIEAIYSYRNDPSVYASLGGHHTGMSRRDVEDWIERHRLSSDLVWVITDADSDVCIGHCGFYQIDYRIGKAELGVAIARPRWGGGLGGRVLAALTDFGFRQLRLHRIETFNLSTNKKIVHIKEQLGYKVEGVLRHVQFRDGMYIDKMVMAILATEWQGIPEKFQPRQREASAVQWSS